LDHCEEVVREREGMMLHELERCSEGFFFCLFDTPDRIQHMLWRFRPQENGVRSFFGAEKIQVTKNDLTPFSYAIEEHYRRCDAIIGKVLEYTDDRTLLIVLSDHGFNSFRRGMHLNTWLHDNGYLALGGKLQPGPESGSFFRNVDWGNTRAYALGLAGIYLNLKGRESSGIVDPNESGALKKE